MKEKIMEEQNKQRKNHWSKFKVDDATKKINNEVGKSIKYKLIKMY